MTTIERDYVLFLKYRIDRPENMVPGDWLAMWDRFENPVNYQEAFEAGVESVKEKVDSDYDYAYDEGYEAARNDALAEIKGM